jgi:8-oxo-dGTP diphosphatase
MNSTSFDKLFQFAYRIAFRLWILRNFFLRPNHEGALVAIWHAGKLLVVRTSYRRSWDLPGGGVGRKELPVDAVIREAREEVGIALDSSRLVQVHEETVFHGYCNDHLRIYQTETDAQPSVHIDGREIIAAEFMPPEQLMTLPIAGYLRRYLARR